ncbi:hypothetical protein BD289DRAFT_272459 [Coniella lustricola]|uniref:Uncharacterized protein n=1 Tax=Coniella lustricola TaxID=2025994 RepID=A0A2T3AKJ1_9PEZI|nr:hypothetical protein BD289DRAFT_272459 [Coniella lustricola]
MFDLERMGKPPSTVSPHNRGQAIFTAQMRRRRSKPAARWTTSISHVPIIVLQINVEAQLCATLERSCAIRQPTESTATTASYGCPGTRYVPAICLLSQLQAQPADRTGTKETVHTCSHKGQQNCARSLRNDPAESAGKASYLRHFAIDARPKARPSFVRVMSCLIGCHCVHCISSSIVTRTIPLRSLTWASSFLVQTPSCKSFSFEQPSTAATVPYWLQSTRLAGHPVRPSV